MSGFVDFTVLEGLGMAAIQCRSEDDADTLVDEMWEQHPELMNYWERSNTKWQIYKEDTCYAPHIYDKQASCMQYCDIAFWLSEGYTIVQFKDLVLLNKDFGEFEASNIELLDLWRR